MIKGKRNLLFDLTPTLPHVPHHSLSALLTRPFPSFSLSPPLAWQPRLYVPVHRRRLRCLGQTLTRLAPQLIQIEIYISTKLFFIVHQLFPPLFHFFSHENENLAETTLCNVEYFVGEEGERERERFFLHY